MSWSFSYTANDKEAALASLEEKAQQSNGHFPDSVKALVADAINALPECEDSEILVNTYGHFQNQEYGRGTSNLMVTVSNTFKSTT